jgi:hypothetical protein
MNLQPINHRHEGEEVQVGYRCPLCEKIWQWRRGVGFDHEMICHKCCLTWEPGELYDANEIRKTKEKLIKNGEKNNE